jgi:hypothetical protein
LEKNNTCRFLLTFLVNSRDEEEKDDGAEIKCEREVLYEPEGPRVQSTTM